MQKALGRALIGVMVALAAASATLAQHPRPNKQVLPPSEERDDRRLAIAELRPRVDWRLLWLGREREVKKVRVRLFKYVFPGARPTVIADAESHSPDDLAHFTNGLSTALMYTPTNGNWAWGSLAFGDLEITTNKDSFRIYLDHKFVLTEEFLQDGNGFVSWTLTKAIDDLLREKTGRGLTEKQFEGLSGEDWLKAERANYAERAEAAKRKQKE